MSSKISFTISDLLESLGGRLIHGNPDTAFNNYCIDSRYVDDHSLFVPLMGQSRDGHQFVIDAISKGAVAALVRSGHHQVHEIVGWLRERGSRSGYGEMDDVCIVEVRHTLVALQKLAEWFRMQFDVQVLGVTGSVGKTGTKEMLIQLLSQKYPTVGTEKNFNNEIGVPLALSRINDRTRMAVIEMAMRARGEISLLSRIAHPNLAIITNTSGSHVGRLGSFEEVYKAKCEIVAGMCSPGKIVINLRDPNVLAVIEELKNRKEGPAELEMVFFDSSAAYTNSGLAPFITPGHVENCHEELPEPTVWLEDVTVHGLDGSTCTLCSKDERAPVHLNMLGRGALENLTAAACAALQYDMSLAEVAEAAPALLPAPQRLNLFQLREELFLVDDCYNSSPGSIIDSLELMLNIDPRYRKILVLGDMLELGKFETLLHRQFAQTALSLPFHAVYAIGPRMNAVNEVEASEDVELYYIEGRSGFEGYGGGRIGSRFGDGDGRGRDQRQTTGSVILDDRAAYKLSAMLLDEINNAKQPTVVLVKGSRALHLERIVNDLLTGTN
ncbi:UDP-N-acetylmuramoyl-tripeptide--D-alanyl-D-alanine ligase [bacterium]|nr:UDP-N-acetylmuramoyl-tripeptide--D-alanyl-D-alanine ligase [bacterium]